jgi:hypothetical protein
MITFLIFLGLANLGLSVIVILLLRNYRRGEKKDMSDVSSQIQAALTSIDTQLTAAATTSAQLSTDVQTLLTKVQGGDTVTADELQAILTHAQTIQSNLQNLSAVDAATDAAATGTATPPATPPASS